MDRIGFLVSQLDATRSYTLLVLQHIPHELWGKLPGSSRTHVLWQVGHLVWSQYGHFARMIGSETDEDQRLIDLDRYYKTCGKGTNPIADESIYMSPDQLLRDLELTQGLAHRKLGEITDDVLDTPTPRPHQIAKSRWDMGLWWSRHESLHTGQIALLRRMHGLDPWR